MQKSPLLWYILAFTGIISAATSVVELDQSEFDAFIANQALLLVEFYAPWCGHCKALAPEYELAASKLLNETIKLAKVDCTVSSDLCQSYDVRGYPTLLVFHEGRLRSEYTGSRKADGIVKYMQKYGNCVIANHPLTTYFSTVLRQAEPAVIELQIDTVENCKTSDEAVVILFSSTLTAPDEANVRDTFMTVAESMRGEYTFGWVTVDGDDASPTQTYSYLESLPALVIYKQFDRESAGDDSAQIVYQGSLDSADAIRRFIQIETVPLFGEIDASSFALYAETSLPLAYLFTNSEAMAKSLVAMLEPIAEKYKGRINFVTIDANRYGLHGGNVGLQREEWPAFAIQHLDSGHKFPFDQSAAISAEAIEQFVEDYLQGKVQPKLKSEPLPKENEGAAVKAVVATEFNDIVLDKSKDVFLTVYAPWCEYCKRMASAWEELGELVQRRGLDNKIVIAKMDGTENDIPLEGGFTVDGFPTLKLFKADTNEVVDFEEELRTLEEMVKFLNVNNGNNAKLYLNDEAESSHDEPRTEHDEL